MDDGFNSFAGKNVAYRKSNQKFYDKGFLKPAMANPPKLFESAFEDYSVSGVIGEGGSGRVFAVEDAGGEEFALKCLFPERVTTEKRKRFKNEIGFSSKTQHPNIIRVLDWGWVEWDNTKCPFYVMPRYPSTLRNLIDGKLSPTAILPLYSQLLNGVEAAHLLGVFHRDLKPENILCDSNGKSIVVADFGIAHFEEEIIATPVKTPKAAKMANLAYSAPEQRAKGMTVEHLADIFALGLILNEMFTGSVPHGAGYSTIASVASDYSYLDSFVDKMIQQNPNARFSTIDEIKRELIGRRNAFVSQQQLGKKRGEVVPVSTPAAFENICLTGVDWDAAVNILTLQLNRPPEPGWVRRFARPAKGYSSVVGAAPHNFKFRQDKAVINAAERDVQTYLNHFKNYISMANEGYVNDLANEARNRAAEQRQELEKRLEEAEARARVLQNLKI